MRARCLVVFVFAVLVMVCTSAAYGQAPVVGPNAIVNGASFRPAAEPGGAVAGGAIVSIFGTNLASATQVALSVPLSTTILDTTVRVNGTPAPLFFVSAGQINAQLPFETPAGAITVEVRRNSGASSQSITAAGVSPGIFTITSDGRGPGAILHAETFALVTSSSPARPNEHLLIFCTGLGPVNPAVRSGEAAATASTTPTVPLVNLGSPAMPVAVTYSGIAPGFVGLYQVNIQLPAAPPSGVQNLQIVMNGVPSNTVTLQIQ